MRKSGSVTALLSTGLFVLAAVTPAAAATGEASSVEPGVTWTSPGKTALGDPVLNPRVSTFEVIDGMRVPDSKPRSSQTGDGGTYRLVIPNTPHSLTIGDVECVRVGSGWAEFAGIVTAVTPEDENHPTSVYKTGEVFLVSVKDGGPGFVNDEIGMKSHGMAAVVDVWGRSGLDVACIAALDNSPFYSRPKAKGVISAGDITVN